jgi:hypothetical protein
VYGQSNIFGATKMLKKEQKVKAISNENNLVGEKVIR